MIDDCIENGGVFFDAAINLDVSCFYNWQEIRYIEQLDPDSRY